MIFTIPTERLELWIMNKAERRPMPDGRIRIVGLLNENQLAALRALRMEGLIMFNFNEVDWTPPETWIEYWFDKERIEENDLRAAIEETVYQFAERD